MRIKNDAKLAALLAASEARARGERPQGTGIAWKTEKSGGRKAAVVNASWEGQCRILGMDTALRKTGWGIIDVNGKRVTAVDCGVVLNPPTASVTDCLRHLNNAIKGLIERYSPDACAIEGGFYCKNARTAIILGTARGAVLGVLAEAHLDTFEYAPRQAKQSVTGRGNASKEQVAAMVANILKIKTDNLADDSTDALALALCHAICLQNPYLAPEQPI